VFHRLETSSRARHMEMPNVYRQIAKSALLPHTHSHEELEALVEDEHVALVEAGALQRLLRGPHRALPLAVKQASPKHVALHLS